MQEASQYTILSTTEPQEEKQPGVATKRCKPKAQKSQKRIHAPAATAVPLEHILEKIWPPAHGAWKTGIYTWKNRLDLCLSPYRAPHGTD